MSNVENALSMNSSLSSSLQSKCSRACKSLHKFLTRIRVRSPVLATLVAEVEGDWCPYPPVLGPMSGILKGTQVKGRELPVFKVREKGKWLEVRVDSDMSDIFCVDD